MSLTIRGAAALDLDVPAEAADDRSAVVITAAGTDGVNATSTVSGGNGIRPIGEQKVEHLGAVSLDQLPARILNS